MCAWCESRGERAVDGDGCTAATTSSGSGRRGGRAADLSGLGHGLRVVGRSSLGSSAPRRGRRRASWRRCASGDKHRHKPVRAEYIMLGYSCSRRRTPWARAHARRRIVGARTRKRNPERGTGEPCGGTKGRNMCAQGDRGKETVKHVRREGGEAGGRKSYGTM